MEGDVGKVIGGTDTEEGDVDARGIHGGVDGSQSVLYGGGGYWPTLSRRERWECVPPL